MVRIRFPPAWNPVRTRLSAAADARHQGAARICTPARSACGPGAIFVVVHTAQKVDFGLETAEIWRKIR
jgi:hypothetical protein